MSQPVDPTLPAAANAGVAALARGQAVGRDVVLAHLGGGGMGVVYAAYDPELDRKVALKLLAPQAAARAGATDARMRLLREAQAMARVSHANVIAVHDVGTWEDQVFIAMELIFGQTLATWTRGRPWREVVGAYVQAGRGLAAAHAAGLVHRDFKPDNVLVGKDDRVRVLDFGLARAGQLDEAQAFALGERVTAMSPRQDALATPLTMTSAFMGTPAYMAPEQWLGQPADALADQFSFCVALWEALYGVLPFDGATLNERRYEVLQGRVKTPPADSRVPAWLREILRRGLAVRPDERLANMESLLGALTHDPAVARRRRLRWGAVAAAILAGAGGMVAFRRHETQMCRGAEMQLAGLWDGARKQAVHAAFVATGAPFAEETYASVARALDDYTLGWSAAHQDACEATRVRGEQSEELLDLRMSCLFERREQTRALSELLAHPDRAMVQHALSAAQSLPPVASCANAVALRAPVPPPADAQVRARIESLRTRIARIRALRDAGKIHEALEACGPVVGEARAIAYAPLSAKAFYTLGATQEDAGDDKAAEESLFEATLLAETGRDDELKAHALIALIYVAGLGEEHPADGERFARQAQAAIARAGSSELLVARLEAMLGALDHARLRPESALGHYRHALAIDERTMGPSGRFTTTDLHNIGSELEDLGRYDEALVQYRRVLATDEASVGAWHPDVAIVLGNIGLVLEQKERHDEALAMQRRALAIDERSLGSEHARVATDLVNIGNIYKHEQKDAEAMAAFRRALAIAEKEHGPDHPQVARVLTSIGEVLSNQGKKDEAKATYERALAIKEKALGADSPTLAVTLYKLGFLELNRGRERDALPYFERQLAVLEKNSGEKSAELISPLGAIARAELGLAQPAKALAHIERGLVLATKSTGGGDVAELHYLEARALWDAGRDRVRAHELAQETRDVLAKDSSPYAKDLLGETDAWLAKHRLSR
jgi:tetratricopeptide (TPR) repeat protein